MNRIFVSLFTISLFSFVLCASSVKISKITKLRANQMKSAGSWHSGCPVAINELRSLQIPYIGFDSKEHIGELVVHKSIAKRTSRLFEELHHLRYPIHKMQPIYVYGGSDFRSIEADNTTGFNCRGVFSDSKRWSKHAYGLAIDINPIENPFVFANGHTVHRASRRFLKRVHLNTSTSDRAKLVDGDVTIALFKRYGFRWGGNFSPYKDYQHFVTKIEPSRH